MLATLLQAKLARAVAASVVRFIPLRTLCRTMPPPVKMPCCAGHVHYSAHSWASCG